MHLHVRDVFVGLRPPSSGPPCWCLSGWAPAWRLHTNLYNFGYNVSSNISKTERNIPLAWILARVFAYLPPFISQILDFIYRTVLIFILMCSFEWRDTENQQLNRLPNIRVCYGGKTIILLTSKKLLTSSLLYVLSFFFNGWSSITMNRKKKTRRRKRNMHIPYTLNTTERKGWLR